MRCGIPSAVREPARAQDGGRRAAAALRVGAPVGPELERHGNDLRPALALAQGGHGGVDAAAERDQDALARGRRVRELEARAGGRGERPGERVRGELHGVAPVRADAAERVGDVVGADQRGLEHGLALGELGRRGGGGAGRRAALGVEARARDQAVGELDRDPEEVAAGRAAGGAVEAVGKRRAQPVAVGEVVLYELGIHRFRERPSARGARVDAARTTAGSTGGPSCPCTRRRRPP